MNAKAWTIDPRLILLSLTLLTYEPAFSHAQNFPRHEASGSVWAAEEPTEQALFQQSPNPALMATESPMLVAQKESKSETNKSKPAGDKGSGASKKDVDEDDEDEEGEEEEDEDDEDKDKVPATKGSKASENKKAR